MKKMSSNEVDVTPIKIKDIETILPKKVFTKIFPYPTVT
jgi:hypothetical protein